MILPGTESQVKELEYFYNIKSINGTSRRPVIEIRNIIKLSNDEAYRIGILPTKEYQKGLKIKIIKSAIF